MSKKKKHHHEEHEEHVNHEAWVIPYADMLTLLMALFLVLWSMGQTDTNKMKQVSTGFADSLGIEGNGSGVGGSGVLDGAISVIKDSTAPNIRPTIARAFEALEKAGEAESAAETTKTALEELQQTLTEQAVAAGIGADLDVRVEARGLVVSIVSEGVLFQAGSAQLLADGQAVLDRIAVALAPLDYAISVEGHTDDRPISTVQFPSNTFLSSARASVVVDYLVARHGFAPGRLEASGYGASRPRVPNTDDRARAQNRRVEIAVLSPLPSDVTGEGSTPVIEPGARPDSPAEELSQSPAAATDTTSGSAEAPGADGTD